MLSIPEISTQIVNKLLLEVNEDSSRTIFIVGSKSVGKSTLLHTFLDKTDTPRETLVLEYSFGRKSNQKQGIEKSIFHIWEYGGKLEILKNVLPTVPIKGKFFCCLMVDLSKVRCLWNTLESCIEAIRGTFCESNNSPEFIFIGGKYDLFKNYDSEVKKNICTTIRGLALLLNASILFYSSKEQPLVKRAKDLLHCLGFGSDITIRENNTNYTKPLIIPKGVDTWESIGINASTIEQIKLRHTSQINFAADVTPENNKNGPQRSHTEPVLDCKVALKYEELSNFEIMDMTLNDYLKSLN